MAGVLNDVKMGDGGQITLFESLLQGDNGIGFAHQEKDRAGEPAEDCSPIRAADHGFIVGDKGLGDKGRIFSNGFVDEPGPMLAGVSGEKIGRGLPDERGGAVSPDEFDGLSSGSLFVFVVCIGGGVKKAESVQSFGV